MPSIYRKGIKYGTTSNTAQNVEYDNSKSGLKAETIQEAIDELNSDFKWKFHKSITGTSPIALPSDYSEILVVMEIPYTHYPVGVSFYLLKENITDSVRYFDNGSCYVQGRIGVKTTEIWINTALAYEVAYHDTSVLKIYYK